MDIPLSADEAARRDRGEIWLSTSGAFITPWVPPKPHSFVRLADVAGELVGRRIVWQDWKTREHHRGWYVIGPAILGAEIPGSGYPDQMYVPVAREADWWMRVLSDRPIMPGRRTAIQMDAVWLDEAEDPTPR